MGCPIRVWANIRIWGRTCPLTGCKYASAKASKSLNFLHHTLWGATTEAKSMTYKYLYLVRPFLEYMEVLYGALTLSQTRPQWNLFNVMQHDGHVGAVDPPCKINGVNFQMFVYKSCAGLPFHLVVTT